MITVLIAVLALTSCAPLPGSSLPAGEPTLAAPDGSQGLIETDTVAPTATPATLPVRDTPTPAAEKNPAITPAAETPTIPGIAEIAILRPGQLSRLASPLRVIASLSDPADSRVLVSLYGEDGRTLAERVFNVLPYNDPINGNVILDLEFSIESLAETGRLELKTFDQFGRLRALNSVTLILLSVGSNDRNYAPEQGERIQLQIPFPGQTEIESSPLLLSGLMRLTLEPDEVMPLTVELIDETGATIAEGLAPVVLLPGEKVGQFVAQIEYQVDAATPVLLVLGVREGRLPGLVYLKTFPIILNP
jgi:hypothetical protein